ncbi:MAG TPA: hypothetical protein VG964_01750 [Candidatus Saccharimonadales bacterium]|nr:hypothetical protein [Candidatus Saccharimonadales bacterium]
MSIQNRISVTLSPRTRKALELAAGLDGSTTASFATQLLSSAIKKELKDNPILSEKMTQLDKQALKKESWDNVISPMTIPIEETQAAQQGWFLSGDNPDGYSYGSDKKVTHKGVSSGFIRSKRDRMNGFGTIMQQTDIADYAGKKLKISAVIKTDKVKDWAGLWVRIDGESEQNLWFDNMQNRPIKGTMDWKRFETSFDVPKEGTMLNFGVLLVGAGAVWINDVSIDELTGKKKEPVRGLSVSLDF